MHKKQKEEILFIVGAVVLVALVAMGLYFLAAREATAVAGAAIYFDNDRPTSTAALGLFEEITVISGSGSCDTLCGELFCIDHVQQADCSADVAANNCKCVG